VQAAPVDPADAARDDDRLRRRPHDQRVELLAAGLGVLLRVVEPRERAPVRQRQPLDVEQDSGGEQRPRQATAPGFVGTRDEAVAELAVEREQPAAAALRGPRALGRARYPAVLARGRRSCVVASRWRRPFR
jgi:hypothetical protein